MTEGWDVDEGDWQSGEKKEELSTDWLGKERGTLSLY